MSTIAALLPAFGISYMAIITVFFIARLEYSRAEFVGSFVAVLVWFAFLGAIEGRIRRLRLLVVPFGNAQRLLGSPRAEWVVAREPLLPGNVSGVVADFAASLDSTWEKLLARAALDGVPVYHWKQVAESLSGMVDIERLHENNLGSLLPSSIYLRFKRVLDVAAALLCLPLVVPILLLAGCAIRLQDGGPAFFTQARVGFRGRNFKMIKLRTMNAANGDEQKPFTEVDDPRVTRIGRCLRRYRIDELPQVINILKGDMSWIGPRPESAQLAAWYEAEVPFYSYRHIVRPGITGWAQVHQGNVAAIQAATGKLRYDFYYIKYLSPWIDVLIAAKTVKAVLTGFGSR